MVVKEESLWEWDTYTVVENVVVNPTPVLGQHVLETFHIGFVCEELQVGLETADIHGLVR